MKIVDFGLCETCVHKNTMDDEDPCYECLSVPAREDSHTPIKYEAVENGGV